MLDDLLELAVEIAGEGIEAVAELIWEKRKKTKKQINKGEPWQRSEKRPPWEE